MFIFFEFGMPFASTYVMKSWDVHGTTLVSVFLSILLIQYTHTHTYTHKVNNSICFTWGFICWCLWFMSFLVAERTPKSLKVLKIWAELYKSHLTYLVGLYHQGFDSRHSCFVMLKCYVIFTYQNKNFRFLDDPIILQDNAADFIDFLKFRLEFSSTLFEIGAKW